MFKSHVDPSSEFKVKPDSQLSKMPVSSELLSSVDADLDSQSMVLASLLATDRPATTYRA